MGRPRAIHHCAGCGEEMFRRGRATDGVRCATCSVDRHVEAVLQINAGEGKFYERWLSGMERAVTKRRKLLASSDNVDGAPRSG